MDTISDNTSGGKPMTDVVKAEIERLRAANEEYQGQLAILRGEIERLWDELADAEQIVLKAHKLRAALERIANMNSGNPGSGSWSRSRSGSWSGSGARL